MDTATPHGKDPHGSYWPVATQADRLSTIAGMIRTADHPHDTPQDALKCIVARIHESTVTDAIWTGLFDSDPECYTAARAMASGLLDNSEINVRLLIMLGEAADLYLSICTGGAIPDAIVNALREA